VADFGLRAAVGRMGSHYEQSKRGTMMPQRIAYAHERQVVGTLLLNLLFAIFEHNEPYLKRHFGASLETMTVGTAVFLAQMASRPPA
jgi:hypothetical protein